MKDQLNEFNNYNQSMSSIIDRRSIYYTTVLSHLITRDGKQMICGLKSGKLALFDIIHILRQNIDFDNKSFDEKNIDSLKPIRRPQQIVSTSSPVYSLDCMSDKTFVVGSKDRIEGWLLEDNNLTQNWSLELPSNDCMANAMATTDEMIFAGCGDHKVYGFDVQTNKQTICLNRHKDYINCISLSEDKQTLYSGGEDGSVFVWDLRANKSPVSEIIPYENSGLSRPHLGKWIGALTLASNDWLICGGGPHLSLWHLGSMSFATTFSTDSTTNAVQMHNEYVISGGNDPDLHIWEMNGELKSLIPTSVNNVFSISTHDYKDKKEVDIQQLITCAGMSHKVDVCTNWKYKDFEILVF